jgi:hypothetical protein
MRQNRRVWATVSTCLPPNEANPARTFATTRSNRNLVTTLNDNRVVHLGLKHFEEAILADLTARLWTLDDGFGGAT